VHRPAAITTLHRLSNEALVARAAAADPAALEELFNRHAPAAQAVAQRVLHDRQLAEDAVQDGFLTVWRSASRFAPERGAAQTWILTLVHHRAVDILRTRAAETRPAGAAAEPAPEGAYAAVDDREAVRGALRSLPEAWRLTLALAYYGGLTQRECAAELDEPLGTIKSRTARGLRHMRLSLDDPERA